MLYKSKEYEEYDGYIVCGTHVEALRFIEKLEEQNVDYRIVIGTHGSLGDWTKIVYVRKDYDPFYRSRNKAEKEEN